MANEVVCDLLETDLQFGLKSAVFRPHQPVEGAFARSHHDRGLPLSLVPVGPDPVGTADSDEEPDRPRIGQTKSQFDFRITVGCRPAQPSLQPIHGLPGSSTLGGAAGAPEEGLYLGESCPELFVIEHRGKTARVTQP